MPRMDSAVADQMSADLAARIANQTPTPGGEAAVRRLSEGMASGKPNYDEMSPMLAEADKEATSNRATIARRPRTAEICRRSGTSPARELDVYLATYEKGTMVWRIGLGPDGKIVNAMVTPDF